MLVLVACGMHAADQSTHVPLLARPTCFSLHARKFLNVKGRGVL